MPDFSNRFAKICPPLYRDSDPSRLPTAALGKVLSWQYGPRGLVLYGDTGTGKSRAAWLLIQQLLGAGIFVVAFDSANFGHTLADRFRDGDATWWLRNLANVPLVFLDDVDKVRFTERVEVELFTLVERRSANKLPVLITTNIVGKTIEQALPRVGRPLVRRLREFCQLVNFGKRSEL